MRRRRIYAVSALAAAAALALSSCGGPEGSKEGGGGTGGTGGSEARGPITFVQGKDVSKGGELKKIINGWNASHPTEKVRFLELSDKADEQRTSMVQNFQARSDAYDVVATDVQWTAEFAARQWLAPLDEATFGGGDLLPAAVETGKYDGKLYATPFNTNAAFLYYRTDLVPTPPTTWAELTKDCETVAKPKNIGCYAGQFAQYEGLTVNASEAINSAGGALLEDSGKTVAVDTPQAREGLQFLVDGFQKGYIPREAITFQEEESRRAFQEGKLLFLRNWPYVFSTANTKGPDSKVAGKFAIAPLPGKSGTGASTLGGYNLAISAFSKHKTTAQDFIKYMQSPDTQKKVLTAMGFPPVLKSVYDDQQLQQETPYLKTLKDALLSAEARPASPNYNEVSLAIQTNAYAALQGKKSVDQAIKDMKTELERASQRG
jgi:multiple sugar transport system substrate-binding protein